MLRSSRDDNELQPVLLEHRVCTSTVHAVGRDETRAPSMSRLEPFLAR